MRKLPHTAIESLKSFTAAVYRLQAKAYLRKKEHTQDQNKVERGLSNLAGNIEVALKTVGSKERAIAVIEAAKDAAEVFKKNLRKC